MTSGINWDILRPVDIGGAVQQGFASGQRAGQMRARSDALAGYGQNPTGGVPAALWALDPDAAATLSQNDRQRVVADRQTQDALRATQARNVYADVLRQELPTGAGMRPALAAPAVGSPTDANGDIIVTAPTQQPLTPSMSIADVAALDPELAANLTKHIGDLDENSRKDFAHKTGVAAAVALSASQLPRDQRAAFIDSQAPRLRDAGWTNDDLADFEPDDDSLHGMVAIGVGADKILADQRQAAGQATTRRGQDISAATARAGQAVSMRGQDIGAATARAGQAVTMRGQDMVQNRANLSQRQKQNVTTKLSDLNAIEAQLKRAEDALAKSDLKGAWVGTLSGRFNSSANTADTAVNNLAPLIRKLTRTPGEGAMSDYESRLAQAGLPSRAMSDEARAEAFAGIKELIRNTRAGYEEMGGGGGSGQVSSTIKRIK